MAWEQSLQISLELWGAVFCLFCALAVWIGHVSKSDRIIVHMEAMVSLLLCMDALAWAFRGSPGVVGYYMVRISNFSVFVLTYLVMVEFGKYIASCIEDRADFPVNTWLWAIYMLELTAIALVILNLFNGVIYYFDANNIYHRTDDYYIIMLIGFAGSVLNTAFLLINARYFEKKLLFSLLSYLIMPTITGVFQFFHYGLSLLNVSIAMSMLLIYFSWQIEKSKQHIRQEKLLLEQKTRMAEQEKEIVSMQQDIMLSQIQPHFLYNSLTAIAQLCEKNPAQAKTATISFADYLRGNMDALKTKEPIPFSKELEHIENYLYLEQIRFGDQLEVLYDIETVDFRVPVLSVQPVVENAVKHGIKRNGTLLIRTQELPETFEIQVIDDGVGFDPEAGGEEGRSHIGIENVRSRLHDMCEGELSYESAPGEGTTATISIPKKKS